MEVRSRISEVGGLKLEVGSWESGVGNKIADKFAALIFQLSSGGNFLVGYIGMSKYIEALRTHPNAVFFLLISASRYTRM